MADRVLIKIFKIPKDRLDSINDTIQKTADTKLVGVDLSNVYSSTVTDDLLIDLTLANLPINAYGLSTDFREGKYRVKYDRQNGAFVTIGNQNFYITSEFNYTGFDEEAYVFHVNPDRVTPSYSKLQTEVRTLGGWEVQHWGNQLTTLKVDGKTGSMASSTDRGNTKLSEAPSIYESTAWKKLVSLRKLYESDQNRRNRAVDYLLGLTYYDGLYVGYFTDFTGPVADKDQPYLMTYSFTFKVIETIYDNGEVSIPADSNYPEIVAGQQNLIR